MGRGALADRLLLFLRAGSGLEPARAGSSYVPAGLALQLTILTLSAVTVWLPPSILNWTFFMRKVHTSSQKRYVASEPCGGRQRMIPLPRPRAPTLNVRRALTRSCSCSAMERSKLATIFIASCGSMWCSLMRSSSVSVSAKPMLRRPDR